MTVIVQQVWSRRRWIIAPLLTLAFLWPNLRPTAQLSYMIDGVINQSFGSMRYGWPACYKSSQLSIMTYDPRHRFSTWELVFAAEPEWVIKSRFSSAAVLVNVMIFVGSVGLLWCVDTFLQRRTYSLKLLMSLIFFISLLLAAGSRIEAVSVDQFF